MQIQLIRQTRAAGILQNSNLKPRLRPCPEKAGFSYPTSRTHHAAVTLAMRIGARSNANELKSTHAGGRTLLVGME